MKRKVNCPGYKRDLRWSDKHEVFNTWRPEITPPRNSTRLPALPALPATAHSLSPTESNLPVEAIQPLLIERPIHLAPTSAQSHSSATDKEVSGSSQTPPGHADNPENPVAFPAATNKLNNNDCDRSSADILREDLREWLASHEPMTLLEQQDWTWTLHGPTLSCDQTSTPFVAATPDCRDAAATSQGSEFNQALVQYFFDNLSGIHTVIDDTAEGFKALVRRYLSSSALLHKSVVCMAAVHCFQDEESMLPSCLECHTAAVRSLSEAVFQIETVLEQMTGSPRNSALSENNMLRKLEETLLASIILGFCAVSTDRQGPPPSRSSPLSVSLPTTTSALLQAP